jgi:hypothetical protein
MTGGTTNSNGTNPRVQSRAGTHNNLLNFKLVVPSATWMSTSIAAVRSNIHWDATYRVGHRMNATEPEALDLVWLQNMAKFPTRGQRDFESARHGNGPRVSGGHAVLDKLCREQRYALTTLPDLMQPVQTRMRLLEVFTFAFTV